jgi:hypothetical protein
LHGAAERLGEGAGDGLLQPALEPLQHAHDAPSPQSTGLGCRAGQSFPVARGSNAPARVTGVTGDRIGILGLGRVATVG